MTNAGKTNNGLVKKEFHFKLPTTGNRHRSSSSSLNCFRRREKCAVFHANPPTSIAGIFLKRKLVKIYSQGGKGKLFCILHIGSILEKRYCKYIRACCAAGMYFGSCFAVSFHWIKRNFAIVVIEGLSSVFD